MEVIKLLTVFSVLVIVLKLKKPLFVSIIAGIISAALLFHMSIKAFFLTLFNAAISWNTISILLVFYFITFLQRMLEKRGSLHLAQQSLDRLFNNRRITASLAPLVLGLLPSASIVVICGEIVQRSVGDNLSTEEKAFVTSYYRHIPESVLPTFSSIIIAISLTQGAVTVGAFMVGMIPMVIALVMLGYVFYLRRIPKETMVPPSDNKWNDFLNLCKGCWPIALIIALILILNFPVYIAATISILLFIFTDHFKLSELKPFVKSAFEVNLLISTFFIMLFKDVLSATGVISTLPDLFSKLPLPEFLIFSLIFFFGTVIGGSQAIAVIGIPLVFTAIPDAGLPMFILLMGIAFAANQITPTHVCLPIAAEYFKISFGALVAESIPVVTSFCAILVAYYFLLILFL
jgi:integral membrane protein (TIGR00529 family)